MGLDRNEHGIENVLWDDLGNGWRVECLCKWLSTPSLLMEDAGREFDDHLENVGLLGRLK